MNALEIYEKVYASWLGKIIGIRIGAPVEGWTHQQILDTYGTISYYPVDYGQFAADDDSNGPLFFSRILNKFPKGNFTAQQCGDHVLDVLCQENGFFWWGGIGVSTEHTAYANLQKGICAPQSGSKEFNGKSLSEQIGGQIFSDCWGYVSLGDIKLAARLAKTMASVTHDGEGLEGAKFIAACIASAYQQTDMIKIVKEGLSVCEPTSSYSKVIQEILHFYQKNPKSPEKCLAYILKKHSYERYEGACPILSNAAIVVYGLLYGNGSFDKIMELTTTAGYDTDCNCGNAGSIAGMAYGLKGIHEKWILPLRDTLISSSSIGALNNISIADSALWFTQRAYALHHLRLPKILQSKKRMESNFLLPYATWGFIVKTNRKTEMHLRQEEGHLKVIVNKWYPNRLGLIEKPIFFRPGELYDNRYDPQQAATVFPGQTISFVLDSCGLPIETAVVVKTYSGKQYWGQFSKAKKVSYTIDKSIKEPIISIGIGVRSNQLILHSSFIIHKCTISNTVDAILEFSKWPTEERGPDYSGYPVHTIAGITKVFGQAKTDKKGLTLKTSLVNFGSLTQSYDYLEWEFIPFEDLDVYFLWGIQDNRHYEGVHLTNMGLSLITRNDEIITERNLHKFHKNSKAKNQKTLLKIDMRYGRIENIKHNKKQSFAKIHIPNTPGMIGILNSSSKSITVCRCTSVFNRRNTQEGKK